MEQVEFEFTFLADSGDVHFVQCFRSGKTGKERESLESTLLEHPTVTEEYWLGHLLTASR